MARLLLVFLPLVLCSDLGITKNNYIENFYLPGLDLKEVERQYREQDRIIERPCPVYDQLCIRRYFARHSNCKIAEGPVNDPMYRTESTVYHPTSNLTITRQEQSIGGLTGTISVFSVDKKSKLTILRIDFKDVTVNSRRSYFRYHRRRQEPAITSTTTDEEFYPSLSITTVFKGVDHLSLADSESVVAINEIGKVVYGPEAGKHPDPTIEPRYVKFLSDQYVLQQEAFLTVAPYFAGIYIQNAICDFELKLN